SRDALGRASRGGRLAAGDAAARGDHGGSCDRRAPRGSRRTVVRRGGAIGAIEDHSKPSTVRRTQRHRPEARDPVSDDDALIDRRNLRLIRWLTCLMFFTFAMTTDAVGSVIPE